jgi:hypothetical protein
MSVNHSIVVTGTNNPAYQVSKDAWNAAHVSQIITVGPNPACGIYQTDGTADEVQINQAISDLNGLGIIQVLQNTTYNLDNPISIVGSSSWFTAGVPNRKLIIKGCGDSSLFNMTASNKNGIELSNNSVVDLLDFKLRMPDSNSGDGIAGLDSGTNPVSITQSYWNNIRVTGCDNTHSCVHLKNPFYLTVPNIAVNGNGNGILLEATAGYNNGNSLFGHILAEYCLGGYSFTMQSLVNTATINLIEIQHIDTYGSYAGLHLNAKNGGRILDSNLWGLDLESSHKQIFVDVDNTSEITGIRFDVEYMQLNGGQIAIDESAANDSHGGNSYRVNLQSDGSSVILSDGGNGYRYPNTYDLLLKGNNGLASGQIVISGTSPKINWRGWGSGYYLMKNPNSGATSISDGGTITHNIGIEPTWVNAIGTVANEFISITAKSATTFTVAIKKRSDGSAGTTQTVYWRAGYYGD